MSESGSVRQREGEGDKRGTGEEKGPHGGGGERK